MFTKPLQRLFSSCLAIAAIMIVISCNPDDEATNTSGGSGNSVGPPDETSEWRNPNLDYGSVTDQDGNNYATIEIGTQEWMAENLRTTKYANGDPIPNVTDSAQWSNLTTGAWAHYENDSQFEVPYGKLYNWYTVADPRNVCPTGWHVPTDAEWTVLTDYLGGEAVAGGKMKSTGTEHWQSPNVNATNESGFTGVPCGSRFYNGIFGYVNNVGTFWSSSQDTSIHAINRLLYFNNELVDKYYGVNTVGLAVRCVRN